MLNENPTATPTLAGLVSWIMANRGTKVFTDWTEEQIAFECWRAVKDVTMLYAMDQISGELTGVVLARKLIDPDTDAKVMSITAVLTTRRGVLYGFLTRFLQMFPDYKLMQATRRNKAGGKRIVYYKDLSRFYSILQNLSYPSSRI